jgi:Fic family protein
MKGLIDVPGCFREGSVGIYRGKKLVHMAPSANPVATLMSDLLSWLEHTDLHPLIVSCIFHYEFEFIHPFVDGNGRMGRLWQTLVLSRWGMLMRLGVLRLLLNLCWMQFLIL